MLVKPLRRTPQTAVSFYSRRVARSEVVDQRPTFYAQFGRVRASMKVKGQEQMAIHSLASTCLPYCWFYGIPADRKPPNSSKDFLSVFLSVST